MTAEEFKLIADRVGLRPYKLAELLDRSEQTLRQYACGVRPIPRLIAEKLLDLDDLINGSRSFF